nr:ABC transporter permease [uncultured Mogibacterium sp.]
MKKYPDKYSVIAHLFLLALVILVLVPGAKKTQPISAMLACLAVIEVLYMLQCRRWHKRGESFRVPSCIVSIVWTVLIIWEILVTKLNCMHPVLYPAPENVFYVYRTQYVTILLNILSSMELLAVSIFIGVVFGVVLGITVGWIPVLSDVFYPIANVLAPIPSVVYAPYIIAIMPSFRSASAMVIVIGIFFPMFLNMVNRVKSIDRQIIDSAMMLNVSNRTMITRILLPYVVPGVIMGMKVTLTTSFMLLIFAEMMGATKGLGYYIVNYNSYGNYTNVIACIIVVGLLVTVLNRLVDLLQEKAIKWK